MKMYKKTINNLGLSIIAACILLVVSCDETAVDPDTNQNSNQGDEINWEAYHDSVFNATLPEDDWGKVRIRGGIDSSMVGEASLRLRRYPSDNNVPKTHTEHRIIIFEFDNSQETGVSIYVPDTVAIAANENPAFPENGDYRVILGNFGENEVGVSAYYDNGAARASIWGTNSTISDNGLLVTISNRNGSFYDIRFTGAGFYNMQDNEFRVDVDGIVENVGTNRVN